MRSKGFRKSTPTNYLSKEPIRIGRFIIPVPPLLTALILSTAIVILLLNVNADVKFMLTLLLFITLMLMTYYRWGVLENRLETHTDLRLGLGKFIHNVNALPENLPKHILCIGEHKVRRLISKTLNYICHKNSEPFELILFYAENEEATSNVIFYELLQRVVSQQIAPQFLNTNIILTVKILPGNLLEGLQTLKRSFPPKTIYLGTGRDPEHSQQVQKMISTELEMPITSIS